MHIPELDFEVEAHIETLIVRYDIAVSNHDLNDDC